MTDINRKQARVPLTPSLVQTSDLTLGMADGESSRANTHIGETPTCLDRLFASRGNSSRPIGECLQHMSHVLSADFAAVGDWDGELNQFKLDGMVINSSS